MNGRIVQFPDVEIEGGIVTFAGVWGTYSPDDSKVVEMQLRCGGDAAWAYLTTPEFLALADQLAEWAASMRQDEPAAS